MNPNPNPIIIGAGLAGLIAAAAWPQAPIYEKSAPFQTPHQALLRFRSSAVADLTGIEFRRVGVRKGIWFEGREVAPSIRMANLYASKCIGMLGAERSIWAVEPVERFIAPLSFYEQLIEAAYDRIHYCSNGFYASSPGTPIISTAPLPVALETFGYSQQGLEFTRAPIVVKRLDLGGSCDVFQTLYFPDPSTPLYRASITGRTLILEFAANDGEENPDGGAMSEALRLAGEAFGIGSWADWHPSVAAATIARQHYGKIAAVNSELRKEMLFKLTHEQQVYSLGRFATWRNILLDDVVKDIAAVKRLIKGDAYALRQAAIEDDQLPF